MHFGAMRYNGILESVHTNKKSIESQLLGSRSLIYRLMKISSRRQSLDKHQKSTLGTIVGMMYSSTDISFELNDSPFVKVLPPFQSHASKICLRAHVPT